MPLKEPWVEKYRPSSLEEYVFPNETIKRIANEIHETGDLPSLLLTGGPGCGKTALAIALIKDLGVDPLDVLMVNTSDENSVDDFRTRIKDFATTWSHGDFRVVILDEFDYASRNYQAALRNFMENEADTCRFIMTANYPHKIDPAIKSRCQWIKFPKPDFDDTMERAANILVDEGVELTEDDINTIDTLVRAGYPDTRKVIHLLQQHVVNGKLLAPETGSIGSEWEVDIINAAKELKFNTVYQIARDNVGTDDFESLYTLLGNAINEPQLIVYIADAAYKSAFMADQDLAFKGLCVKLQQWVDKNG